VIARTTLVLLGLLGGLAGCGDPDRDIDLVSKKSTTKSHVPNTNCMSCHQQKDLTSEAGDTPGFFTMAGTIRTGAGVSQPNMTVILYDALYDTEKKVTGKELMRLDADALGMFYTTKPIPILTQKNGTVQQEEEIFPAVLDPKTGRIRHMYKGVSSGACNVCHHDLSQGMSPSDAPEGDLWTQLP
jgi:hypothetical protein